MTPELENGRCCNYCTYFDSEPYESFGYCRKHTFSIPHPFSEGTYKSNTVEQSNYCSSYEE